MRPAGVQPCPGGGVGVVTMGEQVGVGRWYRGEAPLESWGCLGEREVAPGDGDRPRERKLGSAAWRGGRQAGLGKRYSGGTGMYLDSGGGEGVGDAGKMEAAGCRSGAGRHQSAPGAGLSSLLWQHDSSSQDRRSAGYPTQPIQ